MKAGNLDYKAALVPVLAIVLGFVLLGGSDEQTTAVDGGDRDQSATKVSQLAGPTADAAKLNLDRLVEFDPFQRRGPLTDLYAPPRTVSVTSQQNPQSPDQAEMAAPTLLTESLEAILKTADGWTAIVDSRIVRIGDTWVGDNGRTAQIVDINQNGVWFRDK